MPISRKSDNNLFSRSNVLLFATILSVLFTMYKYGKQIHIAYSTSPFFGKIQCWADILLILFVFVSSFLHVYERRGRKKSDDNILEKIPVIVEKEVDIKMAASNAVLELVKDLQVAAAVRSGDSEAMKILNKYGLT